VAKTRFTGAGVEFFRLALTQELFPQRILLMSTTIRVRPNGPLLVEGGVTILDQHGNAFPVNPDKPAIALCRCGHSANRPFCDGSHKTCGFQSAEIAPSPGA
jgi:CDGSH-type Zn-finger protein